jgi:hypothetical protein
VQPFFNLNLPWRKLSVSKTVGACPTTTITVFNTSFAMDQQCTLLESYRDLIQAACSAMWAASALFVVMAA